MLLMDKIPLFSLPDNLEDGDYNVPDATGKAVEIVA